MFPAIDLSYAPARTEPAAHHHILSALAILVICIFFVRFTLTCSRLHRDALRA